MGRIQWTADDIIGRPDVTGATAMSDAQITPERIRPRQRNDRAREALLLAAVDMDQVIAAAETLPEMAERHGEHSHHVRMLATTISVTYARAMVDSKRASFVIGKKDRAPRDAAHLRELHDHLIDVRGKAYAHTDVGESHRAAAAAGGMLTEEWKPLIVARDVSAIIELARHQQARFRGMATSEPEPA
jgi:hypothetical protein